MPTKPPGKNKKAKPGTNQALRGTFTAEEVARLEGWLPQYLKIKRVPGKKFADFWGPLFQEYFTNHPMPTLTPEELARDVAQGIPAEGRQLTVQRRIKEWFNNHSRVATSGTGKRKLLDLTKDTSPRMLALYQVYGQMNKERLVPIISKEWADKVMSGEHTDNEKAKLLAKVPIDFWNSALRRTFNAEPADVQKAVDVWRRENRATEKGHGSKYENSVDQAEAYHQAQQALVPTMQIILENILDQTKMIGFFTVVGPQPMYGGNIGAITIFSGRNQIGHDFGDVYTAVKWKENIEDPLLQFASTIFSRHGAYTPLPSVTPSTRSTPGPSTTTPKDVREANALDLLPIDQDSDSDGDEELHEYLSQPSKQAVDSSAAEAVPTSPSSQGHEPDTPEIVEDRDETHEGGDVDVDDTQAQYPPQAPVDISLAPTWDNGAQITLEECRVLMALPSDIERARIMTIRLRDCQSLKDGLIERLVPIVEKPVPGAKQAAAKKKKAKVKPVEVTKKDRGNKQSDRTKVSELALSPSPGHSDYSVPIPSTAAISVSSHVSSQALGINDSAIPTWVEEFLEHLSPMCPDERWNSLLVKWVDLERQLGFPIKGRGKAQMLSVTNRPTQIGVWINANRPWNKIPPIGPGASEDYSTSWWLWWRSLQPEWRRLDLSCDLRGHGGSDWNWDESRKGSQNGFSIVILSLGWWFAGLKTAKGKWGCGSAMKDVEWVLDQMLASSASATLGKRTHGDASSGPPSKRGKK
ncbi:hypothetical protein HWV62_28154 [Athelia sp. TMB]|nr:hypothetical protein HWV62_28154 [Athelia sp. TMB]